MEKFLVPSSLFLSLYLQTLLIAIHCHGNADAGQIQTYIVHVQRRSDSIKLFSGIDIENWHKSFLPNTTLDSGEPRLVYSYRDAIGGFAAKLTADEVTAMRSSEGFVAARPDERIQLATTYTPGFLGLSKLDHGIWHESVYGTGVIVGVIDSGIALSHISFSDASMPTPPAKWKGQCGFLNVSLCNNKIIGAAAFDGGRRPVLAVVEDDSNGHGTHVAATVAGRPTADANVLGNAKGIASGIAPKAHLAIYKVCSRDGCNISDILAGIDQAINDGVDILSISIASNHARPFYDDPIAIGSLSAVKKGIVACLPSGNSGPYRSIIYNDAPWIVTVGASSTDRRISATVQLGGAMAVNGESTAGSTDFNPTFLPIFFAGYKGCKRGTFDGINVEGKIVVCVGGFGKSTDMARLVKEAKGAAMIVLNPYELGRTTFAEVDVIPVVHLSHKNALKLMSYLEVTASPRAKVIAHGTQFGARPAPAVAAFSSRGPSLINGGILKPDVIAPGENIAAAWPLESSSNSSDIAFNFLTGTSIATAHVSGVVALLKATHPHWSPAAMRSAILTTADRLDLDGLPISDEQHGEFASVFATGAGVVNPVLASNPGLIYELHYYDYIHYLCGLNYTDEQVTVLARRRTDCSRTRKIYAHQLNYPSISASLDINNIEKNITRHVTNVGEAKSRYMVTVEEPYGVQVDVFPNKLTFSKLNQRKRFHVKLRIKDVNLMKDKVSEGQLWWISEKHNVRSPICITFTYSLVS
ncbi:subtilisin-like protease 4 [Typha latifolia]|uniref:subtilisin-like protease 4 n=1 Tax=Typha latifolia TaxID=4733 RepID=UPI003C2EA99D